MIVDRNAKSSVYLTEIQHFSLHDGPGIRTTVFFKGCPLACHWCHNPETISRELEWMLDSSNNRKRVGKMMTVDEVFQELIKDDQYYRASGGGVTFSGGEPTLQIEALAELAGLCHDAGIHVTVDTCCQMSPLVLENTMEIADLLLCDLKLVDSVLHEKFTGSPNTWVLENLRSIARGTIPFVIRIPLIHDVNDSEEERMAIAGFIREIGPTRPEKVEILPYHALGEDKYRALGIEPRNWNGTVPEAIQEQFLGQLEGTGARARICAW